MLTLICHQCTLAQLGCKIALRMCAGLQGEDTCPDVQALKKDLEDRCGNGEYKDKTILFCWEHKNIPYIVAKLGFSEEDLTWGLNPKSGVCLNSQRLACIPAMCFQRGEFTMLKTEVEDLCTMIWLCISLELPVVTVAYASHCMYA